MSPPELAAVAARWRAEGLPAVVVTVVRTQGSVPREADTRMLVSREAVLGTIGGGHLELKAIEDARALMAECGRTTGSGALEAAVPAVVGPRAVEQRIALGPTLGQCCGGVVHLRLALLADEDPATWAAPPPRFHLQLYGAGHVGRAIVRLLAGIPCRVQWIDEREDQFPAEPPSPQVERLCVEPVEAEVRAAPPGAFFLVLTHSHDLDLAITRAILERGDFGYFGLIGSATKRASFERRLRERGFAPALIERMTCPIGVPGITGKEPEVIAVAAVAQLLQRASV